MEPTGRTLYSRLKQIAMFSVSDLRAEIPGLPEPVITSIRYDPIKKQVSVIDVFRVMTGAESNDAAKDLKNIISANPEVGGMILHFKFRGQGQRNTPVCDAKTLTMLIMAHPSKKVHFCSLILALHAVKPIISVGHSVSPEDR
ncbi:MAG: hypothetical protein ACR2PR_07420 [Pseudohongiellaceae bacterium]